MPRKVRAGLMSICELTARMLGTEPGSSVKAVSNFNCWAISSPRLLFLKLWCGFRRALREELKEEGSYATLWSRFNWHCLSQLASHQPCLLTSCCS